MISKELIITNINNIKLLKSHIKDRKENISFNSLNEYISFLLFLDVDLLNELNYEIKKSLLDYYIIYTTYKYFGKLFIDINEVKKFLINENIVSEEILTELYNLNEIKINDSKYVLLNEIHYANNNKNSILFAQTGTGKTTNIIKYSKIINKKLIIVEPLKSIINSFANENNEYGSYYSGNKNIKDITFVIVELIDEVLNKINQDEYIVCVDEIHELFVNSGWRNALEKILLIDKCIGLTGTPPIANIPKFKKIVKSKASNDIVIKNLLIIDVENNNSITNKFNSIDVAMFNLYKKIFSNCENNINIIFNNLTDKDIFNAYKEVNKNLLFITKDTINKKDTKIDYELLIYEQIILNDIYSTSVLEMGISITETLDKEINLFINFDRCNIYSLVQFISRFRDKKINVIIFKTKNKIKKKNKNNIMNSIENMNIEVNNYIKSNNEALIKYLEVTFKIENIEEIKYNINNEKVIEFIKYYLIPIIEKGKIENIKKDILLIILSIRILYLFIKYKEKNKILEILNKYLSENDILLNEYFNNELDEEVLYNILNIFSIEHNNVKFVDSKIFNILNIKKDKIKDINKIKYETANDEIKNKLYKKYMQLY